jgi:hypothetical protein
VASFLGGTSRQVVWLVPLTVLPYMTWTKRDRPWLRNAALLEWVIVLIGGLLLTKWFNSKPYSIFQPSVFTELRMAAARPLWVVNMTARMGLMLLFMVLPAAIPLVWRSSARTWDGAKSRQLLVGAMLGLVLLAIAVHPSLASIPWAAGTLNWQGVNGDTPLPGRPIVLTRPVRVVCALLVYITVCILTGELFELRHSWRYVFGAFLYPTDRDFPMAVISVFSLAYFGLVIVRSADFDVFDRYLLPIMPWAATILLRWFEAGGQNFECILRKTLPLAWALLGTLAFYSVASTQDLWALAQARVMATRRLEGAGVPRSAIDGAFEYNAWTQLTAKGRMNSRWVTNPLGAYEPHQSQTPVVVPMYKLEFLPRPPASSPTGFGSVPYFSLLPPFHKQVSIDRVLVPPPESQ